MSREIFSAIPVAVAHFRALGYSIVSQDTDYVRMEIEGSSPMLVTIRQRDGGVLAEEFEGSRGTNTWTPTAERDAAEDCDGSKADKFGGYYPSELARERS
jgi:hypothetical protein